MPKTVWIPKDAERDGIRIDYTKSARRLDVSGWYDSFVGIEGRSFTLRQFFDELGITAKDCEKAFREQEKQ